MKTSPGKSQSFALEKLAVELLVGNHRHGFVTTVNLKLVVPLVSLLQSAQVYREGVGIRICLQYCLV